MYYAVTHLTTYKYSEPITDNVMEIRMHPRSDDYQRCLRFDLEISPNTKVLAHQDYLRNTIHFFDLPAPHTRLAIKSESVVEMKPRSTVPNALPTSAWDVLETKNFDRECYDMLLPGQYTHSTELLEAFKQEVDWRRRADPLMLLRELTAAIFVRFEYTQHVTGVDSSIDVALEARRGVCQDFTHIMLTMVRDIGIPCRYVSGYLYHRTDYEDRSDVDASHAWVEAWLPNLGWVGFDPTNNLIVEDRHVAASIGTDYADTAPTRGLFKGTAETELEVKVKVEKLNELPQMDVVLTPEVVLPDFSNQQYQHQQQQQ